MHRSLTPIILLLASCQGQTESPAPASATSTSATAEALLETVRSMLLTSPPDTVGFLDLVYAETPLQERIIRWERLSHEPSQVCNMALAERFGVYSSVAEPFPIWPVDKVTVTSDQAGRAEVSCSDRPREGRTGREDRILYLVKLNDRWWISGYSFEYLDDYSPEVVDSALEFIERLAVIRQSRAVEFADAVRAGRFSSFSEAKAARLSFLATGDWN